MPGVIPHHELSKELVAGMLLIHDQNRDSFWYRFYDQAEDIPAQVPKTRVNASQKEKDHHELVLSSSTKHENLSLRKQLGINQEAHTEMLLREKVIAKHGEVFRFSIENAKNLLERYGFPNAEIEMAKLVRNQRRYYLRLGNTAPGYFSCVKDQVNCGVLEPPRHNMQHTRRKIRSLQQNWAISEESDSSDDNEDDDDDDDDGQSGGEPSPHDNAVRDTGTTKYHILNQLGIDLDLSVDQNKSFINALVGECFALQREYNPGKKATNEYRRPHQTSNTYTISLTEHKSERAYQRYHRHTPYIKEFVDAMDPSPDKATGRIARYLARHHTSVYLSVGQEFKLGLTGIMDAVSAAAMWRDARLLDSQCMTVLKHLRFHFKTRVTVPFLKIYTLTEGYTIPRIKVFEYHKDGEKIPEIVHAQYQSLSREFSRTIQELIIEYDIIPEDILRTFLVLGGDHGQDAFRLCFRALITVRYRSMPYYKTKSIAEVYCKKEEGSILDESVTPWLNEDLKTMKNSQLIVRSDGDEVLCNRRAKVLVPTDVAEEVVLPDVLCMMAADLSFNAYALGKEGGSGHYCPYCPLTKPQWTAPLDLQPIVEPWTLDSLQEMDGDNSKKGPQKLGVKYKPKIEHIEVCDYVVPLTHIGLGIDNDIIAAFEDRVETRIGKVPPTDHIKRTRLASLDNVIEVSREALKTFDATPDGVVCSKLSQQYRDAGKSMTAHEIALLASLDAQRTALAFARGVAKRAKDDHATIAAKSALDTFDKSKDGGKNRTRLMTKKRKCEKQLTVEEKVTLDRVLPVRKALETTRDKSLKEKKDLSEKLADNIQARRKEGKCWFVHMDRLYRKHGVQREDYHKRKFSGRPLQQIKRSAANIFADAKVLLREHKEEGVLDSEIDELCDEVTLLLTSSLDFFEAIMKFPATDADVIDAEQKKERLMDFFRGSDMLKGNITVKGHVIDAHSIWFMKKCKQLNIPFAKIIEQFVELNHQTGKRLDELTKRIPHAEVMANTMCKRKSLQYNAEINKQIRLVSQNGMRGKYNKEQRRLTLAAVDLLLPDSDPGPDDDILGGIGMVEDDIVQARHFGHHALVAAAAHALSVNPGPDANIAGGAGMVEGEMEVPSVDAPAAAVAVTPTTRDKRVVPGDGSVVHVRLLSNFKKGKHC
jgi:hypothetical protein